MIEIKATPKFIRLAKKLISQETLQKLIDELSINPEQGIIIKNTNGIRKIRWMAGKDGNKRNALRIIYYYDGKYLILLLTLFKKSDKANIDDGEKEELRKLIKEIIGVI